VFLMVWFCFLWLWSVPIIILEFAAGRFTRKGGIESMAQLAGPSHRWMGAWVIFVSFAIGYVFIIITECNFVLHNGSLCNYMVLCFIYYCML